MISLKKVQDTEKVLLVNLLQKYLYEMTNFYDDDIDENGNYQYRYFEDYFVNDSRKAFFIMLDENVAGFIMINPYSYIGEVSDYVLAEFCVIPKYRGRHIAEETFQILCEMYQGKWEIKYSNKNTPAMKLWNKVTASYNPIFHELEDDEVVIAFENT